MSLNFNHNSWACDKCLETTLLHRSFITFILNLSLYLLFIYSWRINLICLNKEEFLDLSCKYFLFHPWEWSFFQFSQRSQYCICVVLVYIALGISKASKVSHTWQKKVTESSREPDPNPAKYSLRRMFLLYRIFSHCWNVNFNATVVELILKAGKVRYL